MCKCNPNVRTPFCGKPGCEWPKQETEKFCENPYCKNHFDIPKGFNPFGKVVPPYHTKKELFFVAREPIPTWDGRMVSLCWVCSSAVATITNKGFKKYV